VIPVDRSVRKLFRPIRIGPLTLEHRLVIAPLTRSRSEQPRDIPGSLMRQYYTQRASKGGLNISEATTISLSARGWFGAPGIHPDEQLAGWRSPVVVSLPCQELSIARQSAISRLVSSAISMNRVGTQLALTMALIPRARGMNIEDREEFARRDDHDSLYWSLSSGAPRGTKEADRGRRISACFGPNGSDSSGCGGGSVLRSA